MEYLDVEELKVATTTTTKSSNRQANSNLLILPVKTQVAMLLLFCKNPQMQEHVESLKITEPNIYGIEIHQSKTSCPSMLGMGSHLQMVQ